MIKFKTNYNRTFERNGIKILCEKEIENYDYEIIGNIDEDKLEPICLTCVFMNPDKKYKLKYENFEIIPNNYDDNCGIIDMKNQTTEKHCFYDPNIVSFCLYGTKKMYLKGAIKNLEQYTKQYPNVKCYFYVRADVPQEIIKELKEKGGIIIDCINMINWYMMFCRFLPFENPKNEFYLSRDCDGRLIKREIIAINQWIQSNKKFHIIRDHPYHGTKILGGMWGATKFNSPNLRFLIKDWCLYYINFNKNEEKGPDQFFLHTLYNNIKSEIYVNDEFFAFEQEKFKINHKRENKEYIGEPYDENEKYDQNLRNVIKN